MHPYDIAVLIGYFGVMALTGYICMKRVKEQEDYFMGGRGFGKLLQTFAAFGAGTGSSDPVATGRTTFTGGLSGMWSVMYWLFVTPFYWITAVWYRRMRHLTLGDWFAERYDSKLIGGAYAVFGLIFFMVYSSMLFSAIAKVAAPIMGIEAVAIGSTTVGLQYVLVPVIGLVVLVYGILGGLRAAYWTDLIQGSCIILLSIILIPYGLNALVEKFGDPETMGMMDGFRIMHQEVPPEYFTIVGSTRSSEFPIYRIIAVVLINLVGIVVQPHFIATGGGSAKSELDARVGLVTGNFLKRFCTVGWALTALIALALFADRPELVEDPDRTWGVASKELLAPGLTGLMLACLLAALMSTVDAQMIVGSGLVVRNLYAAYINPSASEKEYLMLARFTGAAIVTGAVVISLFMMDVFKQLQLTWVVPVLFAAPFWIGIVWRRATTAAAWTTVGYCALVFFIIPRSAPLVVPELTTNPAYSARNDIVITTTRREAAPADVKRRNAEIAYWEQRLERAKQNEQLSAEARAETIAELGPRPEPLTLGETFEEAISSGGNSIFWAGGVTPIDEAGNPLKGVEAEAVGEPRRIDENTIQVVKRYPNDIRWRGSGDFKLDFLLYQWAGVDLRSLSDSMLATLELPPKIVAPFLVMILVSLVTPRTRKERLDRYYVKMKTPVLPDHEADLQNLNKSYEDPSRFDHQKLLPGTDIEVMRPTKTDVIGFVVSVLICFGIVWLAGFVAGIGA